MSTHALPLPAFTTPDVPHADRPADKERGMKGWLISGTIHASAILLAMIAVTSTRREPDIDIPATRVTPMAAVEKEKEKPVERRETPVPLENPTPTETDDIVTPTVLDVPPEPTETQNNSDSSEPQGRPEASSDSEAGGMSFMSAMGVGSSSTGMLGLREGGKRRHTALQKGGNAASENGVEKALNWFKRHQSNNGSWETNSYNLNCQDGGKCEPGGPASGHGSDQNVAMTGYALLCFLGAGYDHHTPNKHRAVVKKGLEWLLSVQKNDGYLGLRNYEHPVATMALAEAYAMTSDPALRAPAQKAIDQILAHQNQDADQAAGKKGYGGGLGWDYIDATKRNDASVTGWNVMALKSGMAGGLNVGNGMNGAKKWLEQSWRAANPIAVGGAKDWKSITAYDKSQFGYCWNTGDTSSAAENASGRESIGLACGIFLGRLGGDPLTESLANTIIADQVPKAFPTNTYYLYYNTLAMFQLNGPRWETWNGKVRDLLVNAQRKTDDCFNGSWDWSAGDFTGAESGRLLTTAYCCLSLEVYYRYDQIAHLHSKSLSKELGK